MGVRGLAKREVFQHQEEGEEQKRESVKRVEGPRNRNGVRKLCNTRPALFIL